MKKTYNSPIANVREVKFQNLMAGSLGDGTLGNKEGYNEKDYEGGYAKSIIEFMGDEE